MVKIKYKTESLIAKVKQKNVYHLLNNNKLILQP